MIVMDKDRPHEILDLCDTEVGIVGVKGFMGGFPGSHLPDFGEPSLRGVYAREHGGGRGAGRRPARGRDVPVPDRAAALRADDRDARGRAARDLDVPRHRPAGAADPRAQPGHGPARPRARGHVRGPRSARCRSTTCPCPCWARTSGSSSSPATGARPQKCTSCRACRADVLEVGLGVLRRLGRRSTRVGLVAGVQVDALLGGRLVVAGRAADRAVVFVAAQLVGHDALFGRLGPGALVLVHAKFPYPSEQVR